MKIKNSLLDFINTLCNFIALNIIFVITCLPVITIGSAIIALYFVTMKEARGEYGYLVRRYLSEFKKNMLDGLKLFIAIAVPALILLFNFFFWKSIGSIAAYIITAIVLLGLFILFCSSGYAFALAARFNNTVRQTLVNSIGLAFANIKYTLLLVATDIFFFSAAYYFHTFRIAFIFTGFSFLAYIRSFILIKVFKPFEIH